MYKIIEHTPAGGENGIAQIRVVILADTASDIPEPLEQWAVGSICMIAETHRYKVLNNEGEWV